MINEEKIIISNDINIGATIAYKDKNEKNNIASISIYRYKKYYAWIKDTNGNISSPVSVNSWD